MKHDVAIHLIDKDFLLVKLDEIEKNRFLDLLDRPGVQWIVVPVDSDRNNFQRYVIRRDRIKYIHISDEEEGGQ